MDKKAIIIAIALMLLYFILATPQMADDGFHYEGFTKSLAHGVVNFHDFYGFQGLSILAVPVFWITKSNISIIITSAILSLLSIPLAYAVGKKFGSGMLGIIIYLLMPYPYMTMMRGFQEAALLFFVLLIMYGAFEKKWWTAIAWGFGGIVKPFALALIPLFWKKDVKKIGIWCLVFGICIIGAYGIANYAQTGHFVTLAATGAYEGVFDTNNIPAIGKSFVISWKSWARVLLNLLYSPRKIMVSPLLIIIGSWYLWKNRTSNKNIIIAILLNIFIVGFITYAFPKYLLPAAALLAFSAIPLLMKQKILLPIILIDSLFVFMANYGYFGKIFWPNVFMGFLPFWLAILFSIILWKKFSSQEDPVFSGLK